jgi:predicted RNA binding protein YcfA (HicA-like mRNA interferase family)
MSISSIGASFAAGAKVTAPDVLLPSEKEFLVHVEKQIGPLLHLPFQQVSDIFIYNRALKIEALMSLDTLPKKTSLAQKRTLLPCKTWSQEHTSEVLTDAFLCKLALLSQKAPATEKLCYEAPFFPEVSFIHIKGLANRAVYAAAPAYPFEIKEIQSVFKQHLAELETINAIHTKLCSTAPDLKDLECPTFSLMEGVSIGKEPITQQEIQELIRFTITISENATTKGHLSMGIPLIPKLKAIANQKDPFSLTQWKIVQNDILNLNLFCLKESANYKSFLDMTLSGSFTTLEICELIGIPPKSIDPKTFVSFLNLHYQNYKQTAFLCREIQLQIEGFILQSLVSKGSDHRYGFNIEAIPLAMESAQFFCDLKTVIPTLSPPKGFDEALARDLALITDTLKELADYRNFTTHKPFYQDLLTFLGEIDPGAPSYADIADLKIFTEQFERQISNYFEVVSEFSPFLFKIESILSAIAVPAEEKKELIAYLSHLEALLKAIPFHQQGLYQSTFAVFEDGLDSERELKCLFPDIRPSINWEESLPVLEEPDENEATPAPTAKAIFKAEVAACGGAAAKEPVKLGKKNVSSKEAFHILTSLGFVFVRQKGSHAILAHESLKVVVPMGKESLALGTLQSIKRQAGI